MIKVSQKKYRFLLKLFPQLVQSGVISEEASSEILSQIKPESFAWKRLTRYALLISIFSLGASLIAILTDQWIMVFIKNIFLTRPSVKVVICSLLAVVFYTIGYIRMDRKPRYKYTNEGIMFLGVLLTAGAIHFLGECLSPVFKDLTLLTLLASICYGLLGFFLKSRLIWCFSLLSFGSWLGAESGQQSDPLSYLLFLDCPLRGSIFGVVLVLLTVGLKKNKGFQPFYNTSRNIGLSVLFFGLLMLSLSGCCEDRDVYVKPQQIELISWSVLLGVTGLASFALGNKWGEGAYRGFGLTFLFLNILIRYFEYFWDSMHAALFFLLIAACFWILGSRAEKIWLRAKGRIYTK